MTFQPWFDYQNSRIPASRAQIDRIPFSAPLVVREFLSLEERRAILDEFERVASTREAMKIDLIDPANAARTISFMKKLAPYIDVERYVPVSATVVNLEYAPGPHVDAATIGWKNPVPGVEPYSTLLECQTGFLVFIPLAIDGDPRRSDADIAEVKTIFTKQRWFGVGTNFRRGDDLSTATYFNQHRKAVADYTGMVGLDLKPFSRSLWQKYLKPLPYTNLEGMQCENLVSWRLGQAVIQDASHIHMSSNWKKLGFRSKQFINLNCFDRYAQEYL